MVPEMASRYRRLTDEERATKQREKLYGREIRDDEGPDHVECWNCSEEMNSGARYCPRCGSDQESPPEPDPDADVLAEVICEKVREQTPTRAR